MNSGYRSLETVRQGLGQIGQSVTDYINKRRAEAERENRVSRVVDFMDNLRATNPDAASIPPSRQFAEMFSDPAQALNVVLQHGTARYDVANNGQVSRTPSIFEGGPSSIIAQGQRTGAAQTAGYPTISGTWVNSTSEAASHLAHLVDQGALEEGADPRLRNEYNRVAALLKDMRDYELSLAQAKRDVNFGYEQRGANIASEKREKEKAADRRVTLADEAKALGQENISLGNEVIPSLRRRLRALDDTPSNAGNRAKLEAQLTEARARMVKNNARINQLHEEINDPRRYDLQTGAETGSFKVGDYKFTPVK